MKKKLSCATFGILLCSSSLIAQHVRLNGYTYGVFNNHVDSYFDNSNYYKGTIKGGFLWGAGAEYMLHDEYGIELSYQRMDTKAPITYYSGGIKFTNFDLGVNYIMLGGTRYYPGHNSKIEPFTGIMGGLNIMALKNPDNGTNSDKTFFAWGFKGGANFWASKSVGIKLQAQLLSAVQSVGGGFYFGSGGSGAGIASYSSIYQFGLGGGLVFKFGDLKK